MMRRLPASFARFSTFSVDHVVVRFLISTIARCRKDFLD